MTTNLCRSLSMTLLDFSDRRSTRRGACSARVVLT